MTLFSLYEQKLIRLTDDQGNTFSGVADTFPAEYGLHEYGREEEGIRLGEYIIFKSQISKVEFLPTYEEAVSAIPPGRYRHFKGMEYEVIGIARHSETEEPMVVYRALYGDYGMWVRPASMWNEMVARNGRIAKRFERVEMDHMSANDFKWTREPADYSVSNGMITVKTAPHTDLWQRTYYHFRNDNAPVFQTETEEKFFSFIVKTDFTQSHHRFDQCGIVM